MRFYCKYAEASPQVIMAERKRILEKIFHFRASSECGLYGFSQLLFVTLNNTCSINNPHFSCSVIHLNMHDSLAVTCVFHVFITYQNLWSFTSYVLQRFLISLILASNVLSVPENVIIAHMFRLCFSQYSSAEADLCCLVICEQIVQHPLLYKRIDVWWHFRALFFVSNDIS